MMSSNDPDEVTSSVFKAVPNLTQAGKPQALARQIITLPGAELRQLLLHRDDGGGGGVKPEPFGHKDPLNFCRTYPTLCYRPQLPDGTLGDPTPLIPYPEAFSRDWHHASVMLRQVAPQAFEVLEAEQIAELRTRYEAVVTPELSGLERLTKEAAFFEQEQMTVQLLQTLEQIEAKVRTQIEATLVQI